MSNGLHTQTTNNFMKLSSDVFVRYFVVIVLSMFTIAQLLWIYVRIKEHDFEVWRTAVIDCYHLVDRYNDPVGRACEKRALENSILPIAHGDDHAF